MSFDTNKCIQNGSSIQEFRESIENSDNITDKGQMYVGTGTQTNSNIYITDITETHKGIFQSGNNSNNPGFNDNIDGLLANNSITPVNLDANSKFNRSQLSGITITTAKIKTDELPKMRYLYILQVDPYSIYIQILANKSNLAFDNTSLKQYMDQYNLSFIYGVNYVFTKDSTATITVKRVIDTLTKEVIS